MLVFHPRSVLSSLRCVSLCYVKQPGPWWFNYHTLHRPHMIPSSSYMSVTAATYNLGQRLSEKSPPLNSTIGFWLGVGCFVAWTKCSSLSAVLTLSRSPLAHFWRPISDGQSLERSWLKRSLSSCSRLSCVPDFYSKEEVEREPEINRGPPKPHFLKMC